MTLHEALALSTAVLWSRSHHAQALVEGWEAMR